MFKTARRWRWVSENPLDLVDKPAAGQADTETMDAATIADLLAAYRVLEADADDEERFWFEAARRMTVVALSTGLRRGELLGLRWKDVDLLERRRERSAAVRPKRDHISEVAGRGGGRSRSARSLPPRSRSSTWHPTIGRTSRSCSRIRRSGRRSTRRSSRSTRGGRSRRQASPPAFRPWHGMRHTALTETAAAGVPGMFVQAKAGHAHGSTTERYLHAHKTSYPDAAELAEARLFPANG